jgi:hypothetical protein
MRKTQDMDCGFKIPEAQGSKREEKDLTVIIFELRVDCGLIPRKLRGSLTKLPQLKGYAASNKGGWI